jgi:hypothetical protein
MTLRPPERNFKLFGPFLQNFSFLGRKTATTLSFLAELDHSILIRSVRLTSVILLVFLA